MTGNAEALIVMTALALEFLPLGIERVIEPVVEIMGKAGQVVVSMAVAAESLGLVAGETVLAVLGVGFKFVRMLPVGGMNHRLHFFGTRMTIFAVS